MGDPKRLSALKRQKQKLHDKLQELMETRAYELHTSTAEIDLALEDRDSVLKVFPEEYDPGRQMRDIANQIDKVKAAIKQEES